MGFLQNIFSKSRPEGLPDYLNDYLDAADAIPKNSSFSELDFVVFDTETSSLENDAQLLSIGAVRCSSQEININSILDVLITRNQLEDKPENVEIHGITNRQTSGGMNLDEVLRLFFSFSKGAVLVAQHISFDIQMLNSALGKTYGQQIKLVVPVLDTAELAIRLEQSRFDRSNVDRKQYTLDRLLDRYNIQPIERHSAIGDAYCTALLLLKLLSRLEKRGLKRLSDL